MARIARKKSDQERERERDDHTVFVCTEIRYPGSGSDRNNNNDNNEINSI